MKSDNKRGVYLRAPEDVRRLLSRIVNDTVNEKVSTDVCRAVAYSCNILLRALEATDMEKRLEALENQILGKREGSKR